MVDVRILKVLSTISKSSLNGLLRKKKLTQFSVFFFVVKQKTLLDFFLVSKDTGSKQT